MPKARLAAALALVVASLAAAGCGGPPGSSASPDAVAEFLKENHLDGQVALIQFGTIALDCPLSREGLEKMIAMQRDNTVANLKYLRVEASQDADAVNDYYATKRCGFSIVQDKGNAAAKAFEATVYPTAVLVDKFGRVRYRGKFPDESKLAGWVQTLLEQKTDAGPDATLFGIETADTAALLAATKLPDLAGTVATLKDHMGAKGLLLVFVDTNCPFSGTAIGDMPNVAATLAPLKIPSLIVNIGEPKEDVLAFYMKQKTGTPVVYDETDATKENWLIESVPTVVLMGADGKQIYRGGAVWKDMGSAAEKALGLAAGSLTFEVEGTGFG